MANVLLSVAIYSAQFFCVKGEVEIRKSATTLLPSRGKSTLTPVVLAQQTDLIYHAVDTEMRKQLTNEMTGRVDSDSSGLLQEANQLLNRRYNFRFYTNKGPILSLAFAMVEPGDLVCRRTIVLASGPHSAEPVFALVIPPYRPSNSTRQELFRLVGVCVD